MTQDDPGCDRSEESNGASNDARDPSLETCLELLSNRQRRSIMRFFLDSDRDHATVDELVSAIVEYEGRETGRRPGHDSVAATLYHVHLPRFAEAGVLEYDSRHLEVRFHGNEHLAEVYEQIRELE